MKLQQPKTIIPSPNFSAEEYAQVLGLLKNAGSVVRGIKLIQNPTPLGIASLLADVASEKLTDKTVSENFIDYLRKNIRPATGTGNVGPDKSGTVIAEGGYFRDPTQKDATAMRAGQYAEGGSIGPVKLGYNNVFPLDPNAPTLTFAEDRPVEKTELTPEEKAELLAQIAAQQPAQQPAEASALQKGIGTLETGATLASSGPAFLAGLANLLGTLTPPEARTMGIMGMPQIQPGQYDRPATPDFREALDRYRSTVEALTYMPRTEEGQRQLGAVGEFLEPLAYASEQLGAGTEFLTGSPLAGEYAEEFGLDLLSLGVGKAIVFGAKAKGRFGEKAREAEKLAKDGKSDLKINKQTGATRTSENKFIVATPFKGPRGLELKESLREGGETGFIEKFYTGDYPKNVVLEDFIEFEDFFEAYPEAKNIPVLPVTEIPDVGDWGFAVPAVQFDPLKGVFYVKAQKNYGRVEGEPDIKLDNAVFEDYSYGSRGRTNFAFALQSYVNHKEGLVLPKGALTTDRDLPFAGETSPEAARLKSTAYESRGLEKRQGRLSRSALEDELEMTFPALREELTMPEIYERRRRALVRGVKTSDEGLGDQYVEAIHDVYGFPPPAGDTRALGVVEDQLRSENLTLPVEMGSLVSDLPFNTNLGSFESKLLVNARNLKQEKIGDPKSGKSGPTSGDRYAELLQKTSSAEELELSGILSWLRGRKGVTKADLVFELEKRSVPIRQLDTGKQKDQQLEFRYGIAEENIPVLDPRSKPQNTGTIEFVTDPDRRFVDELGREIDLPRRHGMSKNNFGWVRHSQRAFEDDNGALRRPTLVIEEIQSDIHQKAKSDQGTLLQLRVNQLLRDGRYLRDAFDEKAYGSREVVAENYNDQVTKPAAAQTITEGFKKFKEAFVERSRQQGTREDVIQAGLEDIDNDLRKALSQIDTDPNLQAVNALERGASPRELDSILPLYMLNDASVSRGFFRDNFAVRKIEQMRRAYPELSDTTYKDIYDPRFEDAATSIKGTVFAPFRTQWHQMAIQASWKEALEEDLGGLALTTKKGSGQKAGKEHSQYDNEYLSHLKEIAKRFNLRIEAVDRATNTGGLKLIQQDQGNKPDIRYHYLYLDNPEADLDGLNEFLRTPIRTSGKPLAKAMGGGVESLAPVARNMFRGYDDVRRGVGAYAPYTRRV